MGAGAASAMIGIGAAATGATGTAEATGATGSGAGAVETIGSTTGAGETEGVVVAVTGAGAAVSCRTGLLVKSGERTGEDEVQALSAHTVEAIRQWRTNFMGGVGPEKIAAVNGRDYRMAAWSAVSAGDVTPAPIGR